jgi:hypothetical protein
MSSELNDNTTSVSLSALPVSVSLSALPPSYNNVINETNLSNTKEEPKNDDEKIYNVYITVGGFFTKIIKIYVSTNLTGISCSYRFPWLTKTQAHDIYNYIVRHHGIVKKFGRTNELFMIYDHVVNLLDQFAMMISKHGKIVDSNQISNDKFTILFVTKTKNDVVYVRMLCNEKKFDKTVDYNSNFPIDGERWHYVIHGSYKYNVEVRDYLLQTYGKIDVVDNRLYTSIDTAINAACVMHDIVTSNTYTF